MLVRVRSPLILAMPKSTSFASPPGAISTFSGFTSRCTTPLRWACESAAAQSAPIEATVRSLSSPRRPAARRVGPSISSLTR